MHVFVGGDRDSGGPRGPTPPLQRSTQSRFRANSCSAKKDSCSGPGGFHFRVTGTKSLCGSNNCLSPLDRNQRCESKISLQTVCSRDTGGRVKYSCLQKDYKSLLTSPAPMVHLFRALLWSPALFTFTRVFTLYS